MGVGVGVFKYLYLCGRPLCKHIIIIYGVRYKNAFFTCMVTKLQFAYIFTLLAIFSSSAILLGGIQ